MRKPAGSSPHVHFDGSISSPYTQHIRTMCCVPQVRSIGKRDAAFLFQLGDELIMYAPLHELLAASVPAFLPINIAEVRLRRNV